MMVRRGTCRRLGVFAAACLLMASTRAGAQTFGSVGARSVGLGGVGVALADDPTAVHFNPALIATQQKADTLLLAGFGSAQSEDFAKAVGSLGDADLALLASGDAALTAEVLADLETLSKAGAGVQGSPSAGLYLIQGGVGFSFEGISRGVVRPVVDTVHVAPGDDPATGIANNQTALVMRGLEMREGIISYAAQLSAVFSLGVNLKYVQGIAYDDQVLAFDATSDTSRDLVLDAVRENPEQTEHFSWDLGLIYQPFPTLRIGATGRYLNEPKFRIHSGGEVQLDRQIRAGIAFLPGDSGKVALAADVDVTTPEDPLTGLKTRYLGVGLEWNTGGWTLRGGARSDLEAEQRVVVPTLGIGVGTPTLKFDVGAAWWKDRDAELSVQLRWTLAN